MTKQQILEKVSPADIYLHYLKLQKFPAHNISSPFTEDKRPSFRVYKNGSYKCFSSGHQGDVFQFVADLKHIDCKTKFNEVLNTICKDLNIINLTGSNRKQPTRNDQSLTESAIEKTKEAVFKVEYKELTPLHFNYFNQFGVEPEILQAYGVRAVKYFQFWSEAKKQIIKFPVHENIVAFDYIVNNHHEIYIPQQFLPANGQGQPGAEKTKIASKFIHSTHSGNDIFGLNQLPEKCDHIIITAGKKDCLIINAHGYNAITFRSENHYITEEQIAELRSKISPDIVENAALYICYDNDFEKENNPGQTAQSKIIQRFPYINPILLPDNVNDIADLYFKGDNIDAVFNEAKQRAIAIQKQNELNKETKRTIFHIAEEYLSAHYQIRYNNIKLEIQARKIVAHQSSAILESPTDHVSMKESNQLNASANSIGTKPEAWKKINENSLFVEMQKKGIAISVDKLVSILKSDYTPEYNPVSNYFKNLPPWNPSQPDYISMLSGYIQAREPQQFLHHFKKWLVRTVKCALVPEYFNKQAFILVSPTQNDGKSTFCRFLCPPELGDYIAEDITNDKDARILLCRNFLINLDELAVLSKQEINSLKAFFSKTQINERLPYDRTNSIIPRIASFIGSTNQDEFLADETGSVRWLCFAIEKIDWAYKKAIDINRVWAQALYLMHDPGFEAELSRDDIIQNEVRNKDFQILSIERELISKAFRIPEKSTECIFLTATEIMQHIMSTEIIPARGLSKIAIGRAMKQEGFNREKQFGVYGYNVVPLKHISINHSKSPPQE